MTFLTGGFLAGLALTSVPVIIHLIIRRRRKLVPWGAMQFLTGTPPRFRQRLMKLNELLVLLLRILAITAVVLAFAQPLMFSGVMTRRTAETIFIIDASLSTARVSSAGGTAFTEQIAAAEKALDILGEQETIRILVASDASRWLTPTPLQATAGNREALRSMLRALQPTQGSSDIAMAIAEVLQAPPAADRNARRVVVFSDATDRPWHAADTTRWRAIKKAVSGAGVPTGIAVNSTTPSNPETLTNLTISRLTVDHDTVAAGDSVLLTAEVRNAGAHSSPATEVTWELDGVEVGRAPLPPLGKGVSTTLEYSMPCGKVGSHIARANVTMTDELPADNAAVAAIRTLDEIPVLVVDGGRKPNSFDVTETGFFLAALGQLPGAPEAAKGRAAFQPKIIEPAELANLPLDPYLCIVLADVEAVDLPSAQRLATHVAMGGGLWIALGSRTNPERFNEAFASSAIGLSPLQLGAPTAEVPESAPGWRVLPPSEPHPATALLGDTKQLDIERARVRRHHTIQPPIPGNLSVLLRLESQAPFVIEHAFGKGRVIVQMASLNRAWSNFPILQAYVPMIREFLWRLADGRISRRNIAPGETLRLMVAPGSETSFEVKLPDGQNIKESADEGQIRYSGTFLPGIYRVERVKMAPELFTVPRPSAESDLTPLSDATRRFISEHGARFGDAASNGSVDTNVVQERKSIAPVLLACALALFIMEALLTLFFARQRRVRHGAVVLTPVTTR